MTVRAMAPSSSLAWVAGMRAEVSPAASRVIACASPFSGRVMLRPISQQNASPIKTAPQPTKDDDATASGPATPSAGRRGVVGARARRRDDRSASGSIFSLDKSMLTTQGRTRDAASAHCEKVST